MLHAWAEWEDAALDRLDGMFAFAIWHDGRRELVCACDPFGEKPLYWTRDGQRIVFASDIRAILQARPDLGAPRPDVLEPFLGRAVMPQIDESFFDRVNRLPGAHLLRASDGRVQVRRYWRPRTVEVPSRYEDAVDRLREILLTSITWRLRSDVPLGTSLSGGVDSSAIVASSATLAGDHRRHAFTARFPGFARDEWRYADAVARAANVVEHHAVEPTADGLLDDLDALVSAQEEPFGSTSIYAQWCVMRAVARSRGHRASRRSGRRRDLRRLPRLERMGAALDGPVAVLRGLASGRDRFDVAKAIGSDRLPARLARAYRRTRVTPYATAEVADVAARIAPPPLSGDGFAGPLAGELLRQSLHTILPELLRYADRNSMAHSREVRLPFLSRAVAEFGFSLPAAFVYRNGVTKAVLRDAVRGLVPADVLDRRDKVAFEPPQGDWLAQPSWRALIGDVLLDRGASARHMYRADVIEADLRAGQWRDPWGIWRALNVELWLRAFVPNPRDTRLYVT